MGNPIGKMALNTALGGIRPEWFLPVLPDVGTDREERLADPLYIRGLAQATRAPGD